MTRLSLVLLSLLAMPGLARADDSSPSALTPGELWQWGLVVLVAALMAVAWRRTADWVGARLDPALDELRSAANALESRSAPPPLRAWTPSAGAPPVLLGEDWLEAGALHVVLGDDPALPADLAAELTKPAGAAVAVLSPRLGLADLGTALSRRGDVRSAPRLLLCNDPDAVTQGVAGLLDLLARQGAPAAVVADLQAPSGGAEPATALRALASAAKPALDRTGAFLVVVVPGWTDTSSLDSLSVAFRRAVGGGSAGTAADG